MTARILTDTCFLLGDSRATFSCYLVSDSMDTTGTCYLVSDSMATFSGYLVSDNVNTTITWCALGTSSCERSTPSLDGISFLAIALGQLVAHVYLQSITSLRTGTSVCEGATTQNPFFAFALGQLLARGLMQSISFLSMGMSACEGVITRTLLVQKHHTTFQNLKSGAIMYLVFASKRV